MASGRIAALPTLLPEAQLLQRRWLRPRRLESRCSLRVMLEAAVLTWSQPVYRPPPPALLTMAVLESTATTTTAATATAREKEKEAGTETAVLAEARLSRARAWTCWLKRSKSLSRLMVLLVLSPGESQGASSFAFLKATVKATMTGTVGGAASLATAAIIA